MSADVPPGYEDAEVGTCAECGEEKPIRHYSPDLDIRPVPLCFLCSLIVFRIYDPDND